MNSKRISRLTSATLLAAGFSLIPLTISSSGAIEEAAVCANQGQCTFELGSFCDDYFDYYEKTVDVD
jgi:hypothetical protein